MASLTTFSSDTLLVFGYMRQIKEQKANIPSDLIKLIMIFLYAVINDLTTLDDNDININKILNILHTKFGHRSRYTSIGDRVVIAINPGQQLSKDTENKSLMNEYIRLQQKEVIPTDNPHPLTLVSQALNIMRHQPDEDKCHRTEWLNSNNGHCFVLQGVSGSGKVCIIVLLCIQ